MECRCFFHVHGIMTFLFQNKGLKEVAVLSKIFDNEFYEFEKFSKDFDKNYPCRRLEKPV